MDVLSEYHAAMGELIAALRGDRRAFAGDGLMVLFNDPLPCPDPERPRRPDGARHARPNDRAERTWRRRGHDLGFGVGISMGYATLGQIGFEGRCTTRRSAASSTWQPGCARRQRRPDPGHPRVASVVDDLAEIQPAGDLDLKGFRNWVAPSTSSRSVSPSRSRSRRGPDSTSFPKCDASHSNRRLGRRY